MAQAIRDYLASLDVPAPEQLEPQIVEPAGRLAAAVREAHAAADGAQDAPDLRRRSVAMSA
jgi:hypothetical protein